MAGNCGTVPVIWWHMLNSAWTATPAIVTVHVRHVLSRGTVRMREVLVFETTYLVLMHGGALRGDISHEACIQRGYGHESVISDTFY